MPASSSSSGSVYRAFISYSHADRAWCDWLHKALETYRVPRRLVGRETAAGVIPRRLHPIFRDRDELPSATDLNKRVEQALRDSAWLIVICSPQSASSRWVNEEVLTFKRMGRADRILCLIVAGEPNAADSPGREAQECFCAALRHQVDAGGALTAERTEPIAADARTGKDGKSNAKLKLIAGMLHVGFDALKQRELQRRNRRMAAITAVALVVMAVTTVLAITAVFARNAARVAQQAAERRQKQAEDLVGFMLGDLNNKLDQMHRLDILQSVDDKAVAYFATLPTTDINDTALEQRAKALEKIGSVRMNAGNLGGALDAYDASTRISSRLASAQPGNVARQVAYSRTLAFIGMVHWNQGKLESAQNDFETGRRVLQPSLEHAAGDLSLLEQLTFLDNDIGHVLEARGQPDAALALQRERLDLDRKLVAMNPKNSDYASDLGGSHNDLARLALQRGDLATAIVEYGADDAIETRLSRLDPKDNNQRDTMLETRAILGRTLAMTGDRKGLDDLRQAVDIVSQLVKFDPSVRDFRKDDALYSSQLARLERLNGDLAKARKLTASAVASFSSLTGKEPDDTDLRKYSTEATLEQAAESQAGGEPDAARAQARNALQILEPMLSKHPGDRYTLLATLHARLLLASVTTDPAAAQALRDQALQTILAVKVDRGDPRLLALQVEALLGLGRNTTARPLVEQLRKSGYRDPAFLDVLQHVRIPYPPDPAFGARLAAMSRPAQETPATEAAR